MIELYAPYLLLLLLILVLGGGAAVLLRRRQQVQTPNHGRNKQAQSEDLDTVTSWEPTATRVLSTPEREAYQTLRRALPEHMILGQVPLSRFIKVPTRNSYVEWMRRVGSLSADLLVCDAQAQVVAVVEIRQPMGREKERTQKRHARMDRVLEAAGIPVHVWLEGALPGPAVARETILGGPMVFMTKSGATLVDTAARAKVPPLGQTSSMEGLAVHEGLDTVDVDVGSGSPETRPVSTWFESEQDMEGETERSDTSSGSR